ncbi:MAG: hypothetical protein AAFU65_07835, partial [Pseudomonadota bacterium]
LILAWFFDLTGGRIHLDEQDDPDTSRGRATLFVLVAVLAAALFVSLVYRPHLIEDTPPVAATPDEVTRVVAVMPLDTLGVPNADDADQFALGLHDDLLTTLSRVPSLTVINRSSVLQAAKAALTVRELGERLGATAVLTGTVQRVGQRIRINVSLVDTRSSTNLWSRAIERSFDTTGIFDIQRVVASNIARELSLSLSPEKAVAQVGPQTGDMSAYRAYLLGKRRAAQRTSADLAEAEKHLRRAIDLDPSFAAAYAELAMTYSLQTAYGTRPPSELASLAMPLAQRAVDVAPGLAEAHTALADLRMQSGDRRGGLESYREAIRLNPNYSRARHWYAIELMSDGDARGALEQHRAARDLDPLSVLMTLNVAQDLLFLGQADEAIREYEHALEVDPSFVPTFAHLANANRVLKGRLDESVRWLHDANEADPGHTEYPSQLAMIYLELDDPDLAQRWGERALALGPDQFWPRRANLMVALRHGDEAAAREHAEALMAIAPGQLLALMTLRDLALRGGEIDAARRLFVEEVPGLFSATPEVTMNTLGHALALAHFYQSQGQTDDAAQLLDASAPLLLDAESRDRGNLRVYRAEYFAMTEQPDNAIAELEYLFDAGDLSLWWYLPRNAHLSSLQGTAAFEGLLDTLAARVAKQRSAAPPTQALLDALVSGDG